MGIGSSRFNFIDISDPYLTGSLFVFLNFIIATIISTLLSSGTEAITLALAWDYPDLAIKASNAVSVIITIILYVPLIREGNKVKSESAKDLIPSISILLNFIIALGIFSIISSIIFTLATLSTYISNHGTISGVNTNFIYVAGELIVGLIALYLLVPILKNAYEARNSIRSKR